MALHPAANRGIKILVYVEDLHGGPFISTGELRGAAYFPIGPGASACPSGRPHHIIKSFESMSPTGEVTLGGALFQE